MNKFVTAVGLMALFALAHCAPTTFSNNLDPVPEAIMAARVEPSPSTPEACRTLWNIPKLVAQWNTAVMQYVVLQADASTSGKCAVIIAAGKYAGGAARPWFDWIGEFDPQSRTFRGRSHPVQDFDMVLTFNADLTEATATVTRLNRARVDEAPWQRAEVYVVLPQATKNP